MCYPNINNQNILILFDICNKIKMVVKFIQKIRMRKGALHKQLGISKDDKIPIELLNKIISAESGRVIKNPSKKGRKRIKVTGKLKKRANLAKNLKSISKRR